MSTFEEIKSQLDRLEADALADDRVATSTIDQIAVFNRAQLATVQARAAAGEIAPSQVGAALAAVVTNGEIELVLARLTDSQRHAARAAGWDDRKYAAALVAQQHRGE